LVPSLAQSFTKEWSILSSAKGNSRSDANEE
jgi:hypothetical protein